MDETLMTISAVSLGITSVFSEAGIPSRYKPLISLLTGVGTAVLLFGATREYALLGVIGGLMASGLWAGVKTVMRKNEIPG